MKEKVLGLLQDRIEEHHKALENMPKVDMKDQNLSKLEAMGKVMMIMEREHLHRGAILELKELQLLMKEL